MKIENVKVGMVVEVKDVPQIKSMSGMVATVLGVEPSKYKVGDYLVCLDFGECKVDVLHPSLIKKYKDPVAQYDIPEKAWLLREVMVTDSDHWLCHKVGYVSGYTELENVLVEFLEFSGGHDGFDIPLKFGWSGVQHSANHYCLKPTRLSFVNEDGSLTPMLEEKV